MGEWFDNNGRIDSPIREKLPRAACGLAPAGAWFRPDPNAAASPSLLRVGGIKPVAVVSVNQDSSNVPEAAATLGVNQQDAIVLVTAGKATRG